MVKFKYIGCNPCKDIDLVRYKVLSPHQVITPNMIIEIPDELKELIQRIRVNGTYQEYVEPKGKVVKTTKKEKQKESEE